MWNLKSSKAISLHEVRCQICQGVITWKFFLPIVLENKLMETPLIAIGIKICSDPQILLQAPIKSPGLLAIKAVWFNLPGKELTFTPRKGKAQRWITSFDVVNTLTLEFNGRVTLFLPPLTYNPLFLVRK